MSEKRKSDNVSWFPDNGEKDMSGEMEELVDELRGGLDELKTNSITMIDTSSGMIGDAKAAMEIALSKNT